MKRQHPAPAPAILGRPACRLPTPAPHHPLCACTPRGALRGGPPGWRTAAPVVGTAPQHSGTHIISAVLLVGARHARRSSLCKRVHAAVWVCVLACTQQSAHIQSCSVRTGRYRHVQRTTAAQRTTASAPWSVLPPQTPFPRPSPASAVAAANTAAAAAAATAAAVLAAPGPPAPAPGWALPLPLAGPTAPFCPPPPRPPHLHHPRVQRQHQVVAVKILKLKRLPGGVG